MKIYDWRLAPNPRRVRMFLAEKGLDVPLEEVGTEAPPFQNQRLVNLFIGFTTLAPTDVDIWSIHRDPVTNEAPAVAFGATNGVQL